VISAKNNTVRGLLRLAYAVFGRVYSNFALCVYCCSLVSSCINNVILLVNTVLTNLNMLEKTWFRATFQHNF